MESATVEPRRTVSADIGKAAGSGRNSMPSNSRVVGWSANALEQAAERRIIRPAARYVGPPAPRPVPPRRG